MPVPADTERFARVDALFDRALDLLPVARKAFLHTESDDPEVISEVLRLLELSTTEDPRVEPAAALTLSLLSHILLSGNPPGEG